jgi:site-specific DNA recombinase
VPKNSWRNWDARGPPKRSTAVQPTRHLTLNVLLSFAQFEREVIGERIRDKIAASKKKGCGWADGYRAQDRKLVIVDSEAEIVRLIFRR